ncbi:Aminotransferase, related [Neospora caninum Liverpool]|uniref:Aminotransferase, related n=1 Tax=Neospora caninum (strain Liverpool) TaxID=572307 RepID=F0VFX1_NEOCL|nr:Aminotransferase, related [Neospora caninum Liverpool]CBZ52615.1 Aminotransferase, related [Neospora caninum Liverpool]CEL66594.1 TPA: Aminotransferase, related [Neospora caninum Liverpool]|eukprot:XP_003882647.1 Aminotransferase, related [Neospora caninum Liverpool]
MEIAAATAAPPDRLEAVIRGSHPLKAAKESLEEAIAPASSSQKNAENPLPLSQNAALDKLSRDNFNGTLLHRSRSHGTGGNDGESRHHPIRQPTLTMSSLPQRVLECKYAVRGLTVRRALELQEQLRKSPNCLNFNKLIYLNTGDPQALGQRPLSFYRQVMACVIYPPLVGVSLGYNRLAISDEEPEKGQNAASEESVRSTGEKSHFPSDVVARSRRYLHAMVSAGAYTHSQGLPLFRQDIAAWLERRDGIPTDPDNIFLTDGASSGIRLAMELLLCDQNDGLLIPVPQYPLYAGLIVRLGGCAVPYYLEEETGWSFSLSAVQEAVEDAKRKGIRVRGIIVINPGNPTGTVLTQQEIREIISFCDTERLVLLADEVYQDNVYGSVPFVSARKVLHQMGASVTLFSFHSSSKGLVGECGLRGGLMHVDTVNEDVRLQMYKLVSMFMCGNTLGQLAITCVCSPPKPGDVSYERFQQERQAIYDSMKSKAHLVYEQLNKIEGVTCQPIVGSVFCFPRIRIPPGALREADKRGMEADLLFCLELLEATGIVTVPGSGFGQKPGTYHVRICILPPKHVLVEILAKVKYFYAVFVKKYSD